VEKNLVEHIPFHQLTDYACDRIADHQLQQLIQAHVKLCSECRQTLAIAWQIAQQARTPTPSQPSPALMQRVLKATRKHYSAESPAYLPVVLLHDSKLDAVVSDARGVVQDRALLFTFGRFDLHLSILHAEAKESYTLLGQLLTGEQSDSDIEGSCIELQQNGAALRTVLADELGRFRISHLPAGTYALHISTDLVQTVVESFTI